MTKRSTHEEKEIAWECNKLYFFALYNEYIIPLYFVLCKKNKRTATQKDCPITSFIRQGELYCFAVIFGFSQVVLPLAVFLANEISLKPTRF